MILVALTGGIGAGKSSVSDRLRKMGAVIVDADEVVKSLQRPGETVYQAMVERWGEQILEDDGELRRQAVAEIVFADSEELKALNAMVHPAVRVEMNRQADEQASSEGVVVLDIPLLVEGDAQRRGASGVIVVDCPTELAIERLIEFRGFERADAEARMASQATREERLALADFVIDNSGDVDALDAEVERCWAWLGSLGQSPWPPPKPKKSADKAAE